jgi:hypothetical protein
VGRILRASPVVIFSEIWPEMICGRPIWGSGKIDELGRENRRSESECDFAGLVRWPT